MTTPDPAAPVGLPERIICYSRCLICMRRTPHEICHIHSRALGGTWPNMVPTLDLQEDGTPYYDWPLGTSMFDAEPETCTSVTCPQLLVDWR